MTGMERFVPYLQMAPIVLLLIGATFVVWRGMKRKADDTHNRARGGGSASHWGGGRL